MLDAINSTLEETTDRNIPQSECIRLIFDESTYIIVFKKLNVYVKCVPSSDKSIIHKCTKWKSRDHGEINSETFPT